MEVTRSVADGHGYRESFLKRARDGLERAVGLFTRCHVGQDGNVVPGLHSRGELFEFIVGREVPIGQRIARVQHLPCLGLACRHVRLVKGIHAEHGTGHSGGKFPAKEFPAEIFYPRDRQTHNRMTGAH